jgi:hypothetical protein
MSQALPVRRSVASLTVEEPFEDGNEAVWVLDLREVAAVRHDRE